MAGWISHADCQGLEPRIMADLAHCKLLLDIFNDPARAPRVYPILGKIIMGEEVDKKQDKRKYDTVKKIILATNYNAVAYTLQQQLFDEVGIEVSKEQCQEWLDIYMAKAPELKDFIWDARRDLLRDQEIECDTGFVRHLPHRGQGDYRGSSEEKTTAREFKHAWNQAVNVKVQHLASIIAKLWANFVERARRSQGLAKRDTNGTLLHSGYMGPVHDSVSHDCRTKAIAQQMVDIYARALAAIQGRPMEVLIGRRLRCPLNLETWIAPSWAGE